MCQALCNGRQILADQSKSGRDDPHEWSVAQEANNHNYLIFLATEFHTPDHVLGIEPATGLVVETRASLDDREARVWKGKVSEPSTRRQYDV